MLRCIFGISLPFLGMIFGFALAGGEVVQLLHPPEISIVLGFVLGGLMTAYGFSATWKMFRSALKSSDDASLEQLRKSIMICEGGSKFALYGGLVACCLGVMVTFVKIGGDVSMVGNGLAASVSGLVLGAAIAGIVFQPLKFRFLNVLNEIEESQRTHLEDDHEKVLS